MTGISRWLPRSLFGRLVLVLAGGLLLAQLLSAAINLAERDRLMMMAGGTQQAQRIVDAVKLLESLGAAERERVVAVLSVPPLVLSVHSQPSDSPEMDAAGPRAALFAALLRASFGEQRNIRVQPAVPGEAAWPMAADGRRRGMMGGGPGMMGGGPGMMGGAPAMGHAGVHGGPALRTEVQLRDGSWARFDTRLPPATSTVPWRLALTLAILLVAVLLLSFVAVRWVTRPLHVLAQAAEALGRDLNQPALPEQGPQEIQQAARAFNTMQRRLSHFIEDRTRVLAAMSHDLKTPITRMRLRADLMDDDDLRQHMEADLKEMEAMVAHTLEFMRGLAGNERRELVDVNALLESLQSDNEAMGRTVQVEGNAGAPFEGVVTLLRRCLANLIDNAVLYGHRATVQVDDSPACLTLRVLDQGPGIPPSELENVFEPFHRLESSRSRETGGTGLGLTIARNIAQSHGGDVTLENLAGGGLQAVLTLPRRPPAGAPRGAPTNR